MNFKYFIAVLYLTFVALIVMMVFKSCGQNIELETKDYYNEELKYQSKIDALKLGEVYKDSIQILASKDFVVLQIQSYRPTPWSWILSNRMMLNLIDILF